MDICSMTELANVLPAFKEGNLKERGKRTEERGSGEGVGETSRRFLWGRGTYPILAGPFSSRSSEHRYFNYNSILPQLFFMLLTI